MDDVFRGLGVEVEFDNPENFLKIVETLTRMGVTSSKGNRLYQSCHILHKRGRYAIMHFKEMFLMDGKEETTTVDEGDYAKRNTIVNLLQEWNLLKVKDASFKSKERAPLSQVKIIPFKEKPEWELVQKYSIGKRKAA